MLHTFCRLSLILLLLAHTLQVEAQTTATKKPAKVSAVEEDVWRFQAGDSTGWASLRYNARHWKEIKPDVDLNENPTLWKTGRGWFRQTFRFNRLRNKAVTITIEQFGSSEIYFDGRRIAVLKPVLYDSGGSQRISALLPIGIADSNRHTIAVRYAFRRDPVVSAAINKAPFKLDFNSADTSLLALLDKQDSSGGMSYLVPGLLGLLSLLHFLFYRANPAQRVNRILAAMMLAFSAAFVAGDVESLTGTLTFASLCGALGWVAFSTAFAFLLVSVHTYLGQRPGWVSWSVMGLLGLTALYSICIGPIPNTLVWIPFILVLVEYIRVSWLAKRRNPDPDARLPWNSLKTSLYTVLVIFLILVVGGILQNTLLRNRDIFDWIIVPIGILALFAIFSIPLGLSLSLVRDYARTNRSLQQKVDEVARLSEQTLLQEQEKQQLLARQNEVLEHQVADRTAELKQSLADLRETQTQLIQREKLASLGELTAGIAHEIQNPLNFVNNFSEVSAELVTELEDEQQKPDRDADLETELLSDLKQNLRKITHHGHRASSIVKNMLEHSRTNTGERQLTNLNTLADEYLRLSYQGLRAKDKHGSTGQFNAALKTDFDPNLPVVNLVPQEIGRVLLNLFNNAFYAVEQRAVGAEPAHTYKPIVGVSTRLLPAGDAEKRAATNPVTGAEPTGPEKKQVEIRISDNGTGIPAPALQKIFQPFFTTKPTGEGTGLGLSMAFDIVTKGHAGTIAVDSKEGEGTTFIITLPA